MTCPFCSIDRSRVAFEDEIILALWDGFPVNEGHLLIVPKAHAATWDDLSPLQKAAIWSALDRAQALIRERHRPDGFNVGFNQGAAAGQTVFHFHLHVIPRYAGDVADPRGGVRHVIPAKANYLAEGGPSGPSAASGSSGELDAVDVSRRLVRGGEMDHLLTHLRERLDRATHCDIAVAFLMDSGARLIVEHLRDFLTRGGKARLLVGDYLQVTEPVALRRLNDLALAPARGSFDLRVYEAQDKSFHLKTYIFLTGRDGVAFVGSSNLSQSALTDGIEWNYRVIASSDAQGFCEITAGFEDLFHSCSTRRVDEAWIARYEQERATPDWKQAGLAEDPPAPIPTPHALQIEALEALEATRADGFTAGLVVLATGLGKTWLAAFDSDRPAFQRVLFVAHREEILGQAIETFRRIRPAASIGRIDGSNRDERADLTFASVQTLGRLNHLTRFAPDAFDYIVVDEFHHAAATTYRRIIDHFSPKFLLGLTATPERMDGGDLLALCQENVVFEASVTRGIATGLLCPFQYWGVPDTVDYENIPWRNARFDLDELTAAVATEARAQNALDQFRKHGAQRCIAFCCSQRHADYMADFFRARGVKAVAVHSGSGSAPRTTSLQQLAEGQLEVIFSVDVFNEGVDVPAIDTVLMLRPTESTVIWMQQFGRGLRRAPEKPHLNVIDYVGNHRTFLTKLRSIAAMTGMEANSDGALRRVLDAVRSGGLDLPDGCSVTYDLEAVDSLSTLLRPTSTDQALEAFYRDFLAQHGARPTAVEAFHEGFSPRSNSDRSWLGFVARMEGLSAAEGAAWSQTRTLLEQLEKTEATRSYKIILLLAMLAADALPGSIALADLTQQVSRLAARMAKVRADFSVDVEDAAALQRLLVANPVRALVEARGTGGVSYFRLNDGRFETTFTVSERAAFKELAREILDWRLAQYLSRKDPIVRDIICRVSRATGDRPILFLPNSAESLGLERGPLVVTVDGGEREAVVAKIAINVLRRPGTDENELPDVLRRWFGPDAGLPGRGERVKLIPTGGTWKMEPLGGANIATGNQGAGGVALWERYLREEIPPAFGLTFSQAIWNAGLVVQDPDVFLLVTLSKDGMTSDHRYVDHFISDREFAWQSQNRTTRASKHGQLLSRHREKGKRIHLFIRPTKKTGSKPTPFVYCGQVEFVSWEGDAPISIHWRLNEVVPERLRTWLEVPLTRGDVGGA
ncbi:DUF3427 domain-containing protein [Alsobacter sp. R-9]